MSMISSFRWRSLLALTLQAILVVQLLAGPVMGSPGAGSPHGDWMEICTADGLVKVQLDANGDPAPDKQAPGGQAPGSQAHDSCGLCLPAQAVAPPPPIDLVVHPTAYATVSLPPEIDAPIVRLNAGPPIGARGPPDAS